LPKLFDKFQQFGRTVGAGEKGTGLGLSIAKAIVEGHKGKIFVDSQFGKGTKFTFTLPKYAPEALLRESIDSAIRVAIMNDSKMSLIMVSGENFQSIMADVVLVLEKSLRRDGDIVFKGEGEVFVFLVDCDKENSLRVEERLREALQEYLLSRKLADKIKLNFGAATFPNDGSSPEELIEKVRKS